MAVGAASQRAARVDPPWHPERHAHSSRRVAGARVTAAIPSPDDLRAERDARLAAAVDEAAQRLVGELRADPSLCTSLETDSFTLANGVADAMRAAGWVATVEPQRSRGFFVNVSAPEVQP